MNPRRVLVLGASGFLGRHVCREFGSRGWAVAAALRRPGPAETGAAVRIGRRADVEAELRDILDDVAPAAVVNVAGAVWQPTEEQLETANAVYPAQVAAAVAASPRRIRLVHIGSSLEYSPLPQGVSTDERAPTAPAGAYGRSKLRGTHHVLDSAAAHGVDTVVLRPFNVVGPGIPAESLLGRVARFLLEAKASGGVAHLEVLGQERDFADVRDVAAAVCSAAERPHPAPGVVVNIGSGVATTTTDLVGRLVEASGVSGRLDVSDAPAGLGLDWQRADIATAAALLGWRPRTGLEQTVRDLWADAVTTAEGMPERDQFLLQSGHHHDR